MVTLDEETGGLKLNAKNGKELKLKIKMKLPTLINTKYTGSEVDEIIQTVISLINPDFMKDVCKSINKDMHQIMKETLDNIRNN